MKNADARYRKLIDELVVECRRGQGAIAPKQVEAGKWRGADAESRAIRALLKKLSSNERKLIAEMLSQEFVAGVHTVLARLHFAEMPPFEKGYEGTPFHDFIGRLDDWEWPEKQKRF